MKTILSLVLLILGSYSAVASGCSQDQQERGCQERNWHHCYPMDGCTDIPIGCVCPNPDTNLLQAHLAVTDSWVSDLIAHNLESRQVDVPRDCDNLCPGSRYPCCMNPPGPRR
jgi:hypothetical protein